MIIKIIQENRTATFGTWLSVYEAQKFMNDAIQHNKGEREMFTVFNNIVKEFEFLEEFDRGFSIHDDDVDMTFKLFYHNNIGILSECDTGSLDAFPQRVY